MAVRIGVVCVHFAGGCGPLVLVDDAAQQGASVGNDDPAGTSTGSEDPQWLETTSTPVEPGSTGLDDGSSDDTSAEPVGCEEIKAESLVCATVSDGAVYLIGGDTRRMCELVVLAEPTDATSLAWTGDKVLLCDRADGVGELRLVFLDDGWTTNLGIDCGAVGNYGDGVVLMPWWSPDETRFYETLDALSDDVPDRVVYWHPNAPSVAATAERLYSAQRFADTVDVTELVEPMEASQLVLEASNGRIHGLSVVEDRMFVIQGARGNLFAEFDAGTGDSRGVAVMSTDRPAVGLACRR